MKHFQSNFYLVGGNGKDNFKFSFFYFPGWTLVLESWLRKKKYLNITKTTTQDTADRAKYSGVRKLQNTIQIDLGS
jgi:hypothetical protein